MMTDYLSDDFYALFDVPLETLALSAEAIRTLKWEKITSVAHCLLFYPSDLLDVTFTSARVRLFMYGEVFEQLVTQDYWRMLEVGGRWHKEFQRRRAFERKRLAMWQGQERNLYEVSIDVLMLPVRTHNHLKRIGMITVGDCGDFYWNLRRGIVDSKWLSEADYEELEARLMDLDCWEFIVEQFDD